MRGKGEVRGGKKKGEKKKGTEKKKKATKTTPSPEWLRRLNLHLGKMRTKAERCETLEDREQVWKRAFYFARKLQQAKQKYPTCAELTKPAALLVHLLRCSMGPHKNVNSSVGQLCDWLHKNF